MNAFSKKGQGALEYLIIIGAAILVAVIVVTLIISVSRSNTDQTTTSNEQYTNLIDNTIVPPILISVDCNSTNDIITMTINPSITQGVTDYCLVVNNIPNITTGCKPKASSLSFDYTLTADTTYGVSLIAKKGNAYSQPTMPSSSCKAHN